MKKILLLLPETSKVAPQQDWSACGLDATAEPEWLQTSIGGLLTTFPLKNALLLPDLRPSIHDLSGGTSSPAHRSRWA